MNNDIAVKIQLNFASLVREAASKHHAPFVGFSIEGTRPIAFRRKILANVLEGLTDARAWVSIPAERAHDRTTLFIVSADGKRKYRFFTQERRIVLRETAAYATRKASASCRANGWKRVSEFTEGTECEDGEKTTAFVKAGLKIVGKVVYHAASGKSILIAENHQQAFIAAERALSVFTNWEQDAESLLTSLGMEGRTRMKVIQTEIRYGKLAVKSNWTPTTPAPAMAIAA